MLDCTLDLKLGDILSIDKLIVRLNEVYKGFDFYQQEEEIPENNECFQEPFSGLDAIIMALKDIKDNIKR